MKKSIGLILVAAAIGVTTNVSAQERTLANALTECGIGAMIFPNNETIAIITNVTWDLGTTAVSSNVSSADTCKGGTKKVAQLIQHAYPQLTADISKGQGENLEAMVTAAQCDHGSSAQFKTQVREKFGLAAAQAQGKTQMDKNEDLFGIVKQSAAQAGCSI